MDIGANGGANPIINLEVDEVVGLLVPTFFHYAKPFSLILPHLMSLFSTPIMFHATFLSRFLLRTLSNILICCINNLPHCIKNELCVFGLFFAIDGKVMVIGNTHAPQVNGLNNGTISFFSSWCL
jgi:hypothetical protein